VFFRSVLLHLYPHTIRRGGAFQGMQEVLNSNPVQAVCFSDFLGIGPTVI
jgi:hypothetical protein